MNTFIINGEKHEIDADPDMPLLWVLRDLVGYTGTKFGCGIGLCGVCTVHIDGDPVRSCLMPASAAAGKDIVTIEAIGSDPVGGIVQEAWIEEGVPQCGFCQTGQVMSATALLKVNPSPDDDAIEQHMSGNLCRCGTYNRIKTAINSASDKLKEASK